MNMARYLRSRETEAEKLLWNRLRGRKCYGLKFRRQVPIDKYVVDFLCYERKLIVELDGYMHSWRRKKDARRDRNLMQKGFRIIRFPNSQVLNSIKKVLDTIAIESGVPLSTPEMGSISQ
ncbi:endonuclease domain-containing protein [Patescibacteria group bacterium]|nr:endonuclease domain-containing protein [Patescibacteria group bacterium]MBU1123152.1 endonuclease domain-containing protein [Patescibacteria group bacterium]MBU1911755.1 endonuclease domain-containing protein [Patescibacteria group bacterium]